MGLFQPDPRDDALDRSADELGADPDILFPLARPQIEARLELNRFWAGYDWLPPPLPRGRPVDWCKLPSLNGGPLLFLPRPFCRRRSLCWDGEGIDGWIDSNGCAAGQDLAAARTASLSELIERDATARWWYGGQPARHLHPAALDCRVQAALPSRGSDRPVRFAHLGERAGVHTVLALGTEGDGSYPALGAASDPDAGQASLRAWLELVRGELAWTTRKARIDATPTDRIDPADLRALWWARAAAPVVRRRLADIAEPWAPPPTAPVSPDHALADLLARLAKLGIHVFEQKLANGDPGPPVVRLIAPALAHTKPRLAHPALATGRAKEARTTLPLLV